MDIDSAPRRPSRAPAARGRQPATAAAPRPAASSGASPSRTSSRTRSLTPAVAALLDEADGSKPDDDDDEFVEPVRKRSEWFISLFITLLIFFEPPHGPGDREPITRILRGGRARADANSLCKQAVEISV